MNLQGKSQREVRAIATAAAGGQAPIIVRELPPTSSPFAAHFWECTYASLVCPPDCVDTRRLIVQQGESSFVAHVHHHRAAFKYPCGTCLAVTHTTKDCKVSDTIKEESLTTHTRSISIPVLDAAEIFSKMNNKQVTLANLEVLRTKWAPAVQQRLTIEAEEAAQAKQDAADKLQQAEAHAAAKKKAADERDKKDWKETSIYRRRMQDIVKTHVTAMQTAKQNQHQDLRRLIAERVRVWTERQRREKNEGKKPAAKRDREDTTEDEHPPTAGLGPNPASAVSPPPAARPGRADGETPTDDSEPQSQARKSKKKKKKSKTHRQSEAKSEPVPVTQQEPLPATPEDVKPVKPVKPILMIDTTMEAPFALGTSEQHTDTTPSARQGHRSSIRSTPRANTPRSKDSKPRSGRQSLKTPPVSQTKGKTPTSSRASAARAGAAAASFVPINLAFPPLRSPEGSTRQETKTEADDPPLPLSSGNPPRPPTTTAQASDGADSSAQAHDGGLGHDQDVLMPYGAGVVSPRKRVRQEKPAKPLQDDGDVNMKARGTPRNKRERRAEPEENQREDSDDDFEPAHNQPTFATLSRFRLMSPIVTTGGAKKSPTVQASVTQFFASSENEIQGQSQESSDGFELLEDVKVTHGAATQEHQATMPTKVGDSDTRTETGWETLSGSSQEPDTRIATPAMAPAPLNCIEDWQLALAARIIDNLGDGRCLQQALDGALRDYLAVRSLGNGKFSSKEAYDIKQICITYVLHYLPQMKDDGTVNLRTVHERFFGPTQEPLSDADRYAEVVEHFMDTLAIDQGEAIPQDRWSGPEEIFGLVWYMREPLFIIGADAHVQVYMIEQGTADSQYDERMTILTPTNPEAWAMMQTLINHQVNPRVLVHSGFRETGHYRTFRFAENTYKAWQDTGTGRASSNTRKDRLDNALRSMGMYVAVARMPLKVLATGARQTPEDELELSGSVYTPSAGESDAVESQDDSGHDLTPAQYDTLHEQLNPRQRLRSEEATLWRVAERANLRELRTSDAAGHQAADCTEKAGRMEAALERRMDVTGDAMLLLRRLPYPLVAIATAPAKLITRLGRELTMVGRGLKIHQWLADLPKHEAERYKQLADPDGLDTDARWKAAQSVKLWEELGDTLARDVQQHRTLPQSDEDQMLKMLVSIVALVPGSGPLSKACDQAHDWISNNGADARQLLAELRCHKWTSIRPIAESLAPSDSSATAMVAEEDDR